MRGYFLFLGIVLGSLVLSGCTTSEVRKETDVKDDLSFYPDKTASQETVSPGTNKTAPPPPPATSPSPAGNSLTKKKMYTAPQMTLDVTKKYTATLKTDAGDIVVMLAAKETPITVNNFVFLAREKFYDGTIFHRTIPGFMIQGGDPDGTGMGGPGYKFADEPFAGEYTRGTVAMANSGPNTNGSQFFIMHKDSSLPPNYVIFGKVLSGLEAVDQIASAPTKPGGEGSTPVTPIKVATIEITEK